MLKPSRVVARKNHRLWLHAKAIASVVARYSHRLCRKKPSPMATGQTNRLVNSGKERDFNVALAVVMVWIQKKAEVGSPLRP
jgi:hypothetical protein